MEGRWCTTGFLWLNLALGSVLCCLTGWTRYDRYLTCRYSYTTLPSTWSDVHIPYCLVFKFYNGTTQEGGAIKLVKQNDIEEQKITNYYQSTTVITKLCRDENVWAEVQVRSGWSCPSSQAFSSWHNFVLALFVPIVFNKFVKHLQVPTTHTLQHYKMMRDTEVWIVAKQTGYGWRWAWNTSVTDRGSFLWQTGSQLCQTARTKKLGTKFKWEVRPKRLQPGSYDLAPEQYLHTQDQLAKDASNCLVMEPSEADARINTLCNLSGMEFRCTYREPTEDPDPPTTLPDITTRTTVESTSKETNDVGDVTVAAVMTLSAVVTVVIAVASVLLIRIRRRIVRRNKTNGDVANLCETSTTNVCTGGADEPQNLAVNDHSNVTYRHQRDSHIYDVIPAGNDGPSSPENEHTCVRNNDRSMGTESFELSETSSHYVKMSDMSVINAAENISEDASGYVTMGNTRTESGAETRNEAPSGGEYVSAADINSRVTPTRLRKLQDGASADTHILTQPTNPVRLDVDSAGYVRLYE